MDLLRAALGSYPHTRALKAGELASDVLRLDFADVSPINRAFAPMVREQRFDVSELAIATFLQARAYGKPPNGAPLVLLPVVMAARFQESALLCRTDSDIHGPADLAGKRVGVRAYSQTTGMWLRGILTESHGVRPEQIHWVTFEGAHVAEAPDPAWVARAEPGQDMMAMLRAGQLDAVIVGSDVPKDAALRTVFPDPAAAGEAFRARHGFVPVNHVVVVTRRLADERPELVQELMRLFRLAGAAVDRASLDPAITLAIRYASAQGLLPQEIGVKDLWEGLPPLAA